MDREGENHSDTIIVGGFNILFISVNRSSRQKINKEIMTLNVTLNVINLIDLYKIFYPQTSEYTFFFQVLMVHSQDTSHIRPQNKPP